jgi:hypothetical protein
MDLNIVRASIRFFLAELRQKLEEAAGIAKAADACCESGNSAKAVEIALDVEQLIYEAGIFLNAASLLNQIGKT